MVAVDVWRQEDILMKLGNCFGASQAKHTHGMRASEREKIFKDRKIDPNERRRYA
jgi:hypothetical protein